MSDPNANYTAEQLQEVHDTFSEELVEFLAERTDKTALNWLCTFGVPKEPVEVKTLVSAVYRGGLSLLVKEGLVALTDSGAANDEDAEKARSERLEREAGASQGLGSLFDPERSDRQFKVDGAGGYI